MSDLGWLLVGAGIGAFLTLVVFANATHGTLDGCRAAHIGHDCNIGWVVGEAFK